MILRVRGQNLKQATVTLDEHIPDEKNSAKGIKSSASAGTTYKNLTHGWSCVGHGGSMFAHPFS